jgi:hypothetical protein
MPRSTSAFTVRTIGAPPSSFTACAPVSCSTRPAFRMASSTDTW